MARVCEGTVYSEEISKEYLELVKTVKQVDAIHQCSKSKLKGRGHVGHRSLGSMAGVQIVVPVTLPKNVRHTAKNVFTATRKDILANFVIQSNVESLLG